MAIFQDCSSYFDLSRKVVCRVPIGHNRLLIYRVLLNKLFLSKFACLIFFSLFYKSFRYGAHWKCFYEMLASMSTHMFGAWFIYLFISQNMF